MNIEQVPIYDIKPYENNAKKHTDAQIEEIAKSIHDFGFNQNLVIDKNNVLVVGHGRWEAAKLLGLDTVPCVRAENLTDEQIRLYRLVDNRVATTPIDVDIELAELESIDLDISDYSFEMFDMDSIEAVEGFDENNNDREYFTAAFTFPTAQKEQILKYLRKHKQEITDEIIQKASE